MLLTTTARDLLLATWAVPPPRVRRNLPGGVELALAPDGSALVSLVALRNDGVRVNGLPVPSFAQLAVRTYVAVGGEPALFLLGVRVGPAGLAGAALGIPLRPARIRVGPGRVEARGIGASLRYRPLGPARDVPAAGGTPLGEHQAAAFYSAGLRRLSGRHPAPAWQEAELVDPPLLDPVLAFGFDVREPESLLYAEAVPFAVDLPPEKVADSGP